MDYQFDLLKLMETESFGERWNRMMEGLKAPKDSGEYKYAHFMMIRTFVPWGSTVVSSALILLLAALFTSGGVGAPPPTELEVTVIEPTKTEKLDEIKVQEDKTEVPPPPEEEIFDDPTKPPGPANDYITTYGPASEYSSNPDATADDKGAGVGGDLDVPVVPFAAVMTKSPVIIKGLYGNRTKGGRENALRAYGGGGGRGGSITEGAVLRALRWLKKTQEYDGSWPNHRPAMTGLALLTYLAHGETPASEEFGPTVEKAIRWLLDHRDAQGGYPRSYEHPIATYALCEAYGMTKIPEIRYAAEKALEIIIKGQNAKGGWRYTLTPADESDGSVMGWCAQALKAGKMAGIEVPGLDEAMKRAVDGFRGNYSAGDGYGGFGYTSPGVTGLTGAGVLCLQLLGKAQSAEARDGLATLDQATFDWPPGANSKFNQNYYLYYITQAKFHAGGDRWNQWNKIFAPTLVKNQTVIRGGGVDGKDIGYWEMPAQLSGHTDGVVMNTCLCTLQLEVYYRYLPTFKPVDDVKVAEKNVVAADNLKIEVSK